MHFLVLLNEWIAKISGLPSLYFINNSGNYPTLQMEKLMDMGIYMQFHTLSPITKFPKPRKQRE